MNQLTNHELLQELDRRIKKGVIKIDVSNQIEPDPLTARLFKLRVNSSGNPDSGISSPGLLGNNTLLWIGLGICVFLLLYPKTFTIDSEVKLSSEEAEVSWK